MKNVANATNYLDIDTKSYLGYIVKIKIIRMLEIFLLKDIYI